MHQKNNENSETKVKRKLRDNILILYLEVFVMIILGQNLGGILISLGFILSSSQFNQNIEANVIYQTIVMYASFIGIWIVGILFIKISKNSKILMTQWKAPKGNKASFFLLGILIGFVLNVICIIIACVNKDIILVYDGFHPFSFVLILICVFIQSSAEEFICRGFLYQRLRKGYKNPWVAIIGSSMFFAVAHIFNEGLTVLSLMNIALAGLLFALMVYYMDSIWCAYAAHTAWNFTQNVIFGLPNSGIVSFYSVWKLDAASARNSFAYNVGFGIEGTVVANVVLIIACFAIFLWGQKFSKESYNPWET